MFGVCRHREVHKCPSPFPVWRAGKLSSFNEAIAGVPLQLYFVEPTSLSNAYIGLYRVSANQPLQPLHHEFCCVVFSPADYPKIFQGSSKPLSGKVVISVKAADFWLKDAESLGT